jgi:type II restriction enzyme
VMQYSPCWDVANLMVIPKLFFTESIIERRPPLSSTARRAGWIGCNIVIGDLPPDAKIQIVSDGRLMPAKRVREQFQRVKPLENIDVSLRGWTLEVLRLVRALKRPTFSLSELYAFEGELASRHPRNSNIRPKVRQQLQILRDLGFVRFRGSGNYSLVE